MKRYKPYSDEMLRLQIEKDKAITLIIIGIAFIVIGILELYLCIGIAKIYL